jgi:hypothetical protein
MLENEGASAATGAETGAAAVFLERHFQTSLEIAVFSNGILTKLLYHKVQVAIMAALAH